MPAATGRALRRQSREFYPARSFGSRLRYGARPVIREGSRFRKPIAARHSPRTGGGDLGVVSYAKLMSVQLESANIALLK
jgi:hypothetical protein